MGWQDICCQMTSTWQLKEVESPSSLREAVSVQLKSALHAYWMVLLIVGTITALTCITLYLALLLMWVDVDTKEKLEPPLRTNPPSAIA